MGKYTGNISQAEIKQSWHSFYVHMVQGACNEHSQNERQEQKAAQCFLEHGFVTSETYRNIQ